MVGIYGLIFISLLPFLYLFSQMSVVGNFTYAFANISGFIGAVFLLWEIILGIKELTNKIIPNPALFIKLHIFLGVWGMFFVFIHPILEMFIYMENITFLFFPDFSSITTTHMSYGRIALFLVLLVWFSSTLLRQNISYKKWINIHYLSYLMMFFVFIHALTIGSFLNAFALIRVYWFALMGIYITVVVWRLIGVIKNKVVSSHSANL